MAHAASMDAASVFPVIDFRRQSMSLDWLAPSGTWTARESPPARVHGVALIRASQPNICLFGRGGRLYLQVGSDQYAFFEDSPRIKCTRGVASFGLRRRFSVESGDTLLFSHSYWTNQGEDFFRWLATRAADPQWRAANGRRWSDGLEADALRAS
jgi:hypothetical protein